MGTDGRTDRRTDGQTNQPTNEVSYRGACCRLKRRVGTEREDAHEGPFQISDQSVHTRLKNYIQSDMGMDQSTNRPTKQWTDGRSLL
jgi:hypothetical protein